LELLEQSSAAMKSQSLLWRVEVVSPEVV